VAQVRQALLTVILAGILQTLGAGHKPRFFADDPIQAMPPPPPVGTIAPVSVNRAIDFLGLAGRGESRPPTPAGAINTLGDVPDSEWFTNRHGLKRMNREQLQRGPTSGDAPKPPFTITDRKSDGISEGFRMEDSRGRRYFAKVDPIDHPELTTAADVIGSKFLYAIGYNTPSNEIVYLKSSDLRLSDTARIKRIRGGTRKMAWADVEDLIDRVPRYPDGSFRIVASLAVEGEYVGPFKYEGTRWDDPNDITPHENRRDLRGLYVFNAWINNTDTRAGNTLDTVVEENGTRFIRHYLIDFGCALGSNGNRVKDAHSGYEFATVSVSQSILRVFSLGVTTERWERASYPDLPGVGQFESDLFDPETWKPNLPNTAFLSSLPVDDFWAAKQVMAFTDDDIRAIVETGKYSDPRSADYVATTLAKRRDKIGKTFFSKVLPLDRFRVENQQLLFDDLAVQYGFQPSRQYKVQWSRFDNNLHTHQPIAGGDSTREEKGIGALQLPPEAGRAPEGSYFSAVIHVPGELLNVTAYVRKEANQFKVVGVERNW